MDVAYAALSAWPVPAEAHLVAVVETIPLAEQLVADINTFREMTGFGREAVLLPELETTRRHLMPENEAERSRILRMTDQTDYLFVTSAMSATSPAPPPDAFRTLEKKLRLGDQNLPPRKLAEFLVALDYDNEAEVHMPGEFSWRGGLLDFFSPVHEYPVRVEYFGDEIESLRYFDPETQRSVETIDSCTIIPRGEAALLDEDNVHSFLDYFSDDQLTLALLDPQAIDDHLKRFGGAPEQGQWARYQQSPASQLLLVPDAAILSADDGRRPVHLFPGFALTSQFRGLFPEIELTWETLHQQALATQIERWDEDDYDFIICCSSQSKCEHFMEFLTTHNLAHIRLHSYVGTLSCGMLLPGERLALLTDAEIFGKTPSAPKRRRKSSFHADHMLHEGTELHEGDFAVHAGYGICRFLGIKLEQFHDREQEVLVLEFADDAKIFVPLGQAYLVSRYVGSGRKYPKLSRIGSAHWKNIKGNAESAVADLAADLIRVQAVREASEGYSFVGDEAAMRAFEEAFPYTETEDQLHAIEDVKEDMHKLRPMDRLICGDVGFGKTEVAMRAAFKAVLSGKQVAVLVPTTVLSQQHYYSFCERFREYPVIIENVSRFLTPYRQKQILDATREGRVDILIGTHRLLSFDVHFKDLGLLIIDEEQRFGVKHKERLKRLRANVDILTLTATPIPRTLYMSLAGLRDLSTIVTAPQERLPVQTVVAQYDDTLIEQAIRRELQRKGQVFFLHNRVQTIDKVAAKLKALVPEANYLVAHGQMAEGELEQAMITFIEGGVDVLVCTTIIESGVDIPNANTIIIDRADRFGLADLYQLRGRVGRYHRQAYAYLLIPKFGVMLDNARKRLAAIRKYTQLGAGFKLAMRDLEIRGAGNILGAEQSGHIAAIGFDLYCQLLREAVARMKNNPLPIRPKVQLDLDFVTYGQTTDLHLLSACIPREYVHEETIRVELYRRLSEIAKPADLEEIRAEIRDRFGPPPAEVEYLLMLNTIRLAAHAGDIHAVTVRDQKLMLESSRGYIKQAGARLPRLMGKDRAQWLDQIAAIIQELTSRK